jgi:hypothetical protein
LSHLPSCRPAKIKEYFFLRLRPYTSIAALVRVLLLSCITTPHLQNCKYSFCMETRWQST